MKTLKWEDYRIPVNEDDSINLILRKLEETEAVKAYDEFFSETVYTVRAARIC
jgi:hypothetical protein